ncbi:hypothetical protein CXF83_03810 [Shewanella sp. Choline-02u-19]|nr:hypothetical protein CXF86_12775 [Shewanella sp. GutCb]PKH57792.1 hypothetical protein CXF84_07365 [Shewanella sp. Bg11-22]PKI29790.1 hypothetical protein CXF83_03810 [Shewanella sp. Choline-02u-19]
MPQTSQHMEVFKISRITAAEGIFKISGEVSTSKSSDTGKQSVRITALDIMSTDGWQALDISADPVQTLIHKLNPLILCHLEVEV